MPPEELLFFCRFSKFPYGLSCGSKNRDKVTGIEAIIIESVSTMLMLRRFFLVMVLCFYLAYTNMDNRSVLIKFNALLNLRLAGH